MANNWLFIRDSETGEAISVFKAYPSTGWYSTKEMPAIDDWLTGRDFDATNGKATTQLQLVTETQLCAEGYLWRDGRLVKDEN